MRSWKLALFSVVAALGLVAAACSSSSPTGGGSSTAAGSSGGTGGTITINGETANNHGSKKVQGASSFTLQASNAGSTYFFSPTVLTGSPGQKLTIAVKNTGTTTHNFTLGSTSKDIQPGQSTTVTVTFPQSGSTEFHCRFHRSLGMVGELAAA